ncbi:hypothetical protein FA95DRAFT_507817 [Auriscalpium vulgare]|uniref:Uncharacterized protein n=1 Tax=Auriscalpium vulgare TaxID=40419 RepID=A0ACB8RGB6_9AGAM|nr:hypothetical protein FA95DRAFT_507817 [Auriscalpium vulgare]
MGRGARRCSTVKTTARDAGSRCICGGTDVKCGQDELRGQTECSADVHDRLESALGLAGEYWALMVDGRRIQRSSRFRRQWRQTHAGRVWIASCSRDDDVRAYATSWSTPVTYSETTGDTATLVSDVIEQCR